MEKFPDKRNKKKTVQKFLNTAQAAAVALGAFTTPMPQANPYEAEMERQTGGFETILNERSSATLPYIALLAHGLRPRPASLLSDPTLAHIAEVDPRLVVPLVTNRHVDEHYWGYLENKVFELDAEEPGSRSKARMRHEQIRLLKDASERYGGIDPVELGASVGYVARNIALKKDGTAPHDDYIGQFIDSDFSNFPTSGYNDQLPYGNSRHRHATPKHAMALRQSITAPDPSQISSGYNEIRSEVKAILDRRSDIADLDLFRDTDVLLLSNNQSDNPSQHFGTNAFVHALRDRITADSAGWTFRHIAAPPNVVPLEAQSVKESALTWMRKGERPLTIFFDGHGGERTWSLTNNERTPEVFRPGVDITVSDMIDAIVDRWERQQVAYPDAREVNLKLIFGACYSQNYIRNIAEGLKNRGVPLPQIMISTSEFGQLGFSDDREYGSRFNRMIADTPTVGALLKAKQSLPYENPSIFVPRKKDPKTLMQLGGIPLPSVPAIA